MVAGNHDRCFEQDRAAASAVLGSEIHYLQDEGVNIAGLAFWGSPWQPAYNNWAFNLPRGGALRERWAQIPDHTDVLITHGPPKGFGDLGPYPQRAGCQDLLDTVRRVQPRLRLFGHIHTDSGAWQDGSTTLVNITTWECDRCPTVLDIDTDTGAVELIDVPPARSE